jgi:hypothetical protein
MWLQGSVKSVIGQKGTPFMTSPIDMFAVGVSRLENTPTSKMSIGGQGLGFEVRALGEALVVSPVVFVRRV